MTVSGPAAGDGWRREHAGHVDQALARGDPETIKRVYVELGRLLESAYGDDPEAVPQLSLPETLPVVTTMLSGVHGLLLDAGCGPDPVAAVALAQADPGRTMVALDIGPGTVRLARERAIRRGVTVLGVAGDVERLPFRDGAFAGGVCDDTIEHLPDDRAGAAELMRVLQPDGRMVIATPNRWSLGVLARKGRDRVRGRWLPAQHYYAAQSHLREYTWPALRRLLAQVATVETRRTVGWRGGTTKQVATRVVAVPPFRVLSRMLVVAVTPRQDAQATPGGATRHVTSRW